MTEIERLLTNTLADLEQELHQKQEIQGESLANQQHSLTVHTTTLNQLQQQITRLSAQQEESTRHLLRLSAIYENLEPLLARLNGILSVVQKI